MSLPDWRSAADYEDLRSLDAPGFAWEFLRRNKAFKAERARLADDAACRSVNPEEAEDFARRWGVQFRGRRREDRTAARRLDRPRAAVDGPNPGRRA